MIAIVLLGLFACVTAVPRHRHHHPKVHLHSKNDSNTEIMNNDDLSIQFSNNKSFLQINDKEYKIALELPGFQKKDVNVKVYKGVFLVKAIRKEAGGIESDHFNIRKLPDNVVENGSWVYDNGLLKIVFPIKQGKKEKNTDKKASDHTFDEMVNNLQHMENTQNMDRSD